MNKNIIKLVTLLLSTTLVVSCGAHSRSSSSNGNNYGDISDSGVTSSDIPSSSSIDDGEQGELDKIIAEFTSDLDVAVPSVDEYDLFYEVYYYYSYQQYVISAANSDTDNFESDYLAKFTSDTGLVSLNDDSYYTVEDYGYMFGDDANNPNLTITFYTEEGVFYLTITRADGLYGTLDVSDIDTNWYVDYVNFNNFILSEEFPETDINVTLETDLEIPSITADVYPYAAIAPYEDENGSYPLTYYVVFEGDKLESYCAALKTAGFDATIKESTEETIDWDTFQIVEVTVYTLEAIDTDHTLFIYGSIDESGNTLIAFYRFDDVSNDQLTTNTDWTSEEKALMVASLGQELPFMAFGSDYELSDESDDDWDLLVLTDTYYQDLSGDYANLLLAAGFTQTDIGYGTCYIYDNGIAYIEIYLDFYSGHYYEIYFEPSKLPAVSSFTLNKTAVDIVPGATYQLKATFEPANAARSVTWETSNADIATVNENGLVEINESATAGQTVTITAKAIGNLSASCVFTIASGSLTGVEYTQSSYTIIPGGTKIKPEYDVLPIGAFFLASISYELVGATNEEGIYYDEDGYLWATSDAVIGKTFTIKVKINDALVGTASVTVIAPTITDTINQEFFGLVDKSTTYATHTKTTAEGATYEAQCASQTGVQIRSKNQNSGIIGHFEGRTCKSITFNFNSSENTLERTVNIYGSNSPFTINDMYGSTVTKVGSVTYSANGTYTFTYTFTDAYSYIGFRMDNGAAYFDSIVVIWE